MLPTDIEKHLMETLAVNKIMRDFKITTNTRLQTVRDLNWNAQRTNPQPVPALRASGHGQALAASRFGIV